MWKEGKHENEERKAPGLAPGLVSRIGHPVNEPNKQYMGAIIGLSMCWREVSENPKNDLGEEKLHILKLHVLRTLVDQSINHRTCPMNTKSITARN